MHEQRFWDDQAKLPGLRAVIDPNDLKSHKNTYLDCLHKTVLGRHGRFDRSSRVLDFGCGFGRITFWLAAQVASVHATDANRSMIERAGVERRRRGSPNVCLTPYDGARLPFASSSFTRVTSVWVLQHIVDDIELSVVLAEIARVSRPQARLLFIERTAETPVEPWLRPELLKRRTVAAYRQAFAEHRLAVVRSGPIWDGGPTLGHRRLDRWILSGRLPEAVLPLIARLDVEVRKRRPSGDWSDHLFVCERR